MKKYKINKLENKQYWSEFKYCDNYLLEDMIKNINNNHYFISNYGDLTYIYRNEKLIDVIGNKI